MTCQEIYKEYDCLNKPYQEGASLTPNKLHTEVMKHLDFIGNDNPHFIRLNEIETDLRNWSF